MQFDSLPDSAYAREAQLLQNPKYPNRVAPLPFSSQTLGRRVKDGSFPAPVKLGPRVVAWHVGTVRAWLAKQGGSK
jgi:prophage regulatory protein